MQRGVAHSYRSATRVSGKLCQHRFGAQLGTVDRIQRHDAIGVRHFLEDGGQPRDELHRLLIAPTRTHARAESAPSRTTRTKSNADAAEMGREAVALTPDARSVVQRAFSVERTRQRQPRWRADVTASQWLTHTSPGAAWTRYVASGRGGATQLEHMALRDRPLPSRWCDAISPHSTRTRRPQAIGSDDPEA